MVVFSIGIHFIIQHCFSKFATTDLATLSLAKGKNQDA